MGDSEAGAMSGIILRGESDLRMAGGMRRPSFFFQRAGTFERRECCRTPTRVTQVFLAICGLYMQLCLPFQVLGLCNV